MNCCMAGVFHSMRNQRDALRDAAPAYEFVSPADMRTARLVFSRLGHTSKTRPIVRRERCAHITRIGRNANFATSDAACLSETSGATAESAHGAGKKSATSKQAVTDCRRLKLNHALCLSGFEGAILRLLEPGSRPRRYFSPNHLGQRAVPSNIRGRCRRPMFFPGCPPRAKP
jgi:hypothetical protein